MENIQKHTILPTWNYFKIWGDNLVIRVGVETAELTGNPRSARMVKNGCQSREMWYHVISTKQHFLSILFGNSQTIKEKGSIEATCSHTSWRSIAFKINLDISIELSKRLDVKAGIIWILIETLGTIQMFVKILE